MHHCYLGITTISCVDSLRIFFINNIQAETTQWNFSYASSSNIVDYSLIWVKAIAVLITSICYYWLE